jgi:shikimate dehydrogenase
MNDKPMITGATKIYGIIGYPVSHSLSPLMQNAALSASKIDGIYLPFAVKPEQLSVAVSGLRALQLSGFNVTIPHKTSIISLLDELAPTAVQAGAVNTVVNDNGRLLGHNTDGDGLLKSLKEDLKFDPADSRVLLIGAGGAARGALAALCRAGVASVTVCNRTAGTASRLITDFKLNFPGIALKVIENGSLSYDLPADIDMVINATSLGMAGEKIEGLSLALLPDHAKVYDMVYTPAITPLLSEAKERGLMAVNGLGMLVSQGELAFSLWHSIPPENGVMRAALESSLP